MAIETNVVENVEREEKLEKEDKQPGTSKPEKDEKNSESPGSASTDKDEELKTNTVNDNYSLSNCSACLEKTPHSQLFVCMKEGCGYALKQTMPVMSPGLFYTREAVFCGDCAYLGLHAPHRDYLRSAEPLAFYTSSGEVGTRFEMEFEKFQKLSDTSPVDYFIMKAIGKNELSKIPFTQYLESSKSIDEWHHRQFRIFDALRIINEQREEGHRFVKNEAEKLLTAYSKVSQELEREQNITNKEKAEEDRVRLAEHRQKMGIKPEEEKVEKEKSFSSVSSRSGKSSMHSNATNQTVRQIPSKSDMKKAMNVVDEKITERVYTSIRVESFDEPETETVEPKEELTGENDNFIDESVRQTIMVMDRRFSMIRRYASVKDTIEQLADLLDSRIESVRHRREVVDYMQKTYHIKWSRQLY